MLCAGHAGDQLDREDKIKCGQLQLLRDGGSMESKTGSVSGICAYGWGFGGERGM